MTAEIISVGTELLLGDIIDSNAAEIGRELARHGISHQHRQTVGDNQARLVAAMNLALSRSDLVITIGGLGPTEDDMTRSGISAALDSALTTDEGIAAHLQQLFESRGLRWTESQLRQAERPDCAKPIPNQNGTAPGLDCRKNGKIVLALPGPPNELIPMLRGPVRDIFHEVGPGFVIHSRTLKILGLGESLVEKKLHDLMQGDSPTVAPYAKTGEVHLRLTARRSTQAEAEAVIAPVEAEIRRRIGSWVYAADEETLADSIVGLLKAKNLTLSVAESCTGGGLGSRITATPGASDVFLGGVISYANEVKISQLGVRPETLEAHGAVSEECAREMAEGARRLLGSDYAISVTGIAGPGGGSEAKPVGLVYVGIAGPDGTHVHEHRFIGQRETVRTRSQMAALGALRQRLL